MNTYQSCFTILSNIYQLQLQDNNMPSTLYNSVKQSVVQYAEIRKKNEGTSQKLLFRWKLITIMLAIVFIIMLGVFSQFLTSVNNIPDVQSDNSFIVTLLMDINPQTVVTLNQAYNLLKGITATGDHDNHFFQWNTAQKIYSGSVVANDVVSTIKGKQNLLFVFTYEYNATNTARFGLYAHRGYSGQQSAGGLTTVKDNGQSRYSSIFNINTGETVMYNSGDCNLFAYNNIYLNIFEGMTTMDPAGESGLSFNIAKPECYHTATINDGFNKLISITGITQSGQPTLLPNITVEIFQLSLNQDTVEQF